MAGEEKWSAQFDTSAVELGYYRMQRSAQRTQQTVVAASRAMTDETARAASAWQTLNSRAFDRPAKMFAAAISGSFAIGAAAIKAAGEQSATARAEIERTEQALTKFYVSLGRDLAGGGGGGFVAQAIAQIDTLRQSIANGLADVFYGKGAGAEFDAAARSNDQAAKEQERQRTYEAEIAKNRQRTAELHGDNLGRELAVIDARERAERQRIASLGLDPTRTRELQDAARGAAELERQQARGAQGQAERDMEIEYREGVAEAWQKENDAIAETNERQREHERYVQARRDELSDAAAMVEIDRLRTRGLDHQAKAEEVRLRWARERRQIERDENLTWAEREDLVRQVNEREAAELSAGREAMQASQNRERPRGRFAANFGAPFGFLREQVFGREGSRGQATKTEDKLDRSIKVQEQMRELLQRIAVDGVGGAVLV